MFITFLSRRHSCFHFPFFRPSASSIHFLLPCSFCLASPCFICPLIAVQHLAIYCRYTSSQLLLLHYCTLLFTVLQCFYYRTLVPVMDVTFPSPSFWHQPPSFFRPPCATMCCLPFLFLSIAYHCLSSGTRHAIFPFPIAWHWPPAILCLSDAIALAFQLAL